MFWNELYWNTKNGINNLIRFRKAVWGFWDFDYHSSLKILKFNLELLYKRIENGHEIEESRDKKLLDIKRCIELLNNQLEDDYVDRVGGLNSSKYPFEFEDIDPNIPKDSPLKRFKLKEFCSEKEQEEDSKTFEKARKLEEKEWKELWETISNGKNHEFGMRGWWD